MKVTPEDALGKENFGVPLDIPCKLVQGEGTSGTQVGTREITEDHEQTLRRVSSSQTTIPTPPPRACSRHALF